MFSSATAGTFKNAAHYKNATVDALLDKALGLTDQSERAKLYEEATRIVVDEAAGLWIYNTKWYGPYSNKLKGIVFCPIGSAQEMRTAYYDGFDAPGGGGARWSRAIARSTCRCGACRPRSKGKMPAIP